MPAKKDELVEIRQPCGMHTMRRNLEVLDVKDLCISVLLDRWSKKDYNYVADQLWINPPHATALFMTSGTAQGILTILGRNRITNLLMDRFIEERDRKENGK